MKLLSWMDFFKGLKLIVPKKLRNEMLEIIHILILEWLSVNREHVKCYFGRL